MRFSIILFCLTLTACADFPQLDALNDSAVVPDYPSFIPFDQIPSAAPTDSTSLEQRAANLRARAAALRNTTP